MAILFNDPFGGGQEEVKLGTSRITPRETYSASPEGIRSQYADQMRNVEGLVSALSGLSSALGRYEAQRQMQTDENAWRTRDLVNGVKSDDAVGAFSSAASGTIASGASPRMQNRLQEYYGYEAARSYLSTNEELRAILIDENLRANPAEFEKRMEGFVTNSIEELRKRNPNMIFAGGAAQFIRNFANNAKSNSFEFANKHAREELDRAGVLAIREGMPQSAVFNRVTPVITDLGGDPTEARQVLSIENPQMNTRAVSPERSSNAAAGLFQIKPNTFAEVAQYPEARQYNLTNPMDERQNAIAYQIYWNRMKGQAEQILGRAPKTAEVYMLYNLGPGAGGNALRAYAAGRDGTISEFASEAAIRGNPKLYRPDMTVSAALNRIDGLMKGGSDFHAPITPLQSRQRVELTQDNFNSRNYSWNDFKNNGVYGGRGQIDSRIVNILDDVTDQFGRKLKIISAHRDQAYDRQKGGKGNHPHGDSIDIDTSGMSNEDKKKLVALFVANGVRGIGTYASGNSIHVDLAVGRELSGRQGEGVQSWNKAGHAWFNEGLASGREIAGSGYVRRPGFQNTPFNSTEAQTRILIERYGYAPNRARATVLQETQNYALNQAHAGMGPEASLTAEALRTNLKLTPTEELSLNGTLRTIESIQTQNYQRKLQQELMEANEYKDRNIREALQAEKEGRQWRPDPDKMPQTESGRKAYQELMSIGLAPLPVARDVSQTNLMALTSRVDDPELYKELGFEEGQRPRNVTETLAAIQKTKSRDLSPDDRLKLAETIELRRVGGPVAERYATESAKENSAKIADAFTVNTAALQRLNMNFENPQQFAAELSAYTKRMSDFYQSNYSELYRSAVQSSPSGALLSAEEREVIAKKALENTQAYGRYLSAIIANSGPKMSESTGTQAMITNPSAVVEQIIQQNNGRIEGQIPGIPRGSVIMVSPDGKPMQMGDGSYQVRTPNGQVVYYNPYFAAQQAAPSMARSIDERETAAAAAGRANAPTQPQATQSQQTPRSTDTPEGQSGLEQEASRRNQMASEARQFVSEAVSRISTDSLSGVAESISSYIQTNPAQKEMVKRFLRETVTKTDPVLRQLGEERMQIERPETTSLRPNAPKRGMTKEEKAELANIDKLIAEREKALMEAFKTILNK